VRVVKLSAAVEAMDELKGLRVAILVVEGNLVARATEAA
jgi:hypothetical protein